MAALGLSGGTRTLSCIMWDPGPQPGIEPRPLHWECRVTTIGLPGMSQVSTF